MRPLLAALLLTLAACADDPIAAEPDRIACASALDPADCRACVALEAACQATDTPGRCLAERCTGCGYCSPDDCRAACAWAADYSAARCVGSACAAEAADDRAACAVEDPCRAPRSWGSGLAICDVLARHACRGLSPGAAVYFFRGGC